MALASPLKNLGRVLPAPLLATTYLLLLTLLLEYERVCNMFASEFVGGHGEGKETKRSWLQWRERERTRWVGEGFWNVIWCIENKWIPKCESNIYPTVGLSTTLWLISQVISFLWVGTYSYKTNLSYKIKEEWISVKTCIHLSQLK